MTEQRESGPNDIGVAMQRQVVPVGAVRYGVVIAIEKYHDPRLDLRCARADGQAMYDLMTDPSIGLFDKRNVTLLLDQDATRERIRRTLAGLRRSAGAEDTVWIYYCGHGAPEGGDTYWVTHDADVDDLYATALSSGELHRLLHDIKTERFITFLDCCHAAATTHQKYPTRDIQPSAGALEAFKGKGRITFSSSDGDEKSVELPDKGHGAFTYFLKRGLSGEAGTGGNGVVTADHLWQYLRGRVAEASRRVGKPQTPILEGKISHDVALTLNPAVTAQRKELARFIESLVGLGDDHLRTDEAEFCLELLRHTAWDCAEAAVVAEMKELHAGSKTVPSFRRMLQVARTGAVAEPLARPGPWVPGSAVSAPPAVSMPASPPPLLPAAPALGSQSSVGPALADQASTKTRGAAPAVWLALLVTLGGFLLFLLAFGFITALGSVLWGAVGWIVRTAAITSIFTVVTMIAARLELKKATAWNGPDGLRTVAVVGSVSGLIFAILLGWRITGPVAGAAMSLSLGAGAASLALYRRRLPGGAISFASISFILWVLLLFGIWPFGGSSSGSVAGQDPAAVAKLVGRWNRDDGDGDVLEFTPGGMISWGNRVGKYRLLDRSLEVTQRGYTDKSDTATFSIEFTTGTELLLGPCEGSLSSLDYIGSHHWHKLSSAPGASADAAFLKQLEGDWVEVVDHTHHLTISNDTMMIDIGSPEKLVANITLDASKRSFETKPDGTGNILSGSLGVDNRILLKATGPGHQMAGMVFARLQSKGGWSVPGAVDP